MRSETRARDKPEAKEAFSAPPGPNLARMLDQAQVYLDLAGVMFVALDPEGKVVLVNRKGGMILGCAPAEIVGRNWFDTFVPPLERARVRAVFDDLMCGRLEHAGYFENPVLTRDGRTRLVAWHNAILRDEAGRITGALGSGEDITERKRAEEELRQSEERYRLAQQAAHIGTFEWNIRTGANTWTPELEAMYGLPPGGFAGTQPAWESLIHPDDRAETLKRVQQTFETNEPTEGKWRVIWPDRSVHWLYGRWQLFRDESGKPLRLTGVNIDITERRKATEGIESLAEFPAQNPNPVLRVAADGTILYANEASAGLLALWSCGQGDPLPDPWRGLVLETMGNRTPCACEVSCGTRVYALTFTPAGPAEHVNVYGLDITERKRAENVLRQSEEQYRTLAANLPGIVYRVHLRENNRMQFFNDQLPALTGYGVDELSSGEVCPLDPLIHADDRRRVISAVQQALAEHGRFTVEYRFLHKDGSVRHFIERGRLMENGDHQPLFIDGVIHDITEGKQVEEQIRQNAQIQAALNRLLRLSLEDLTTEEVLEQALGHMTSLPWFALSQGAIFLADDKQETLVMAAQRGLPGPLLTACARVPFGGCLCGRAALSRQVEFADCVDGRHEKSFAGMGPHGHYCVPILSGGKVLGVIDTYVEEGHLRSQKEEDFLCAAAAVIAGIIERQRAAEELRNTRNYLENLLDYANAPIIVWNPDRAITRFNHGFERLTGWSADEVLGKRLDLLFPDDEREASLRHIQRAVAGERWEVVEIPIRRRDGTVRTVLWNSATLFHSDGTTPLATIAQGEDITERKRAEEELRNTRNYLENLLDYANAPIIVWNPDRAITRFNHAFERLTGWSADEVLGKRLDRLFPDDEREASLQHIQRAVAGERWEVVEIPIRRRDGTVRTVLWNSATLFHSDGTTPLATIAQGEDITERKHAEEAALQAQQALADQQRRERERAEAELAQVREELIRTTRLATIGQVSASIAHDLRNPLGAVRNAAFLLKRRVPQETHVLNLLKIVEEEVLRADQIITRLLVMARTQTPPKQRVDLGQMIAAVCGRIEPMRQVRLVVNLDPNPFWVQADPVELDLVVSNLMTNAAEAMAGKGTFSVEAVHGAGEDTIVFRDTGPGIAPEIADTLFDPLVTTKANGTGLGLTICRQIVGKHGGMIQAANVPDGGAAFTVRLPQA